MSSARKPPTNSAKELLATLMTVVLRGRIAEARGVSARMPRFCQTILEMARFFPRLREEPVVRKPEKYLRAAVRLQRGHSTIVLVPRKYWPLPRSPDGGVCRVRTSNVPPSKGLQTKAL